MGEQRSRYGRSVTHHDAAASPLLLFQCLDLALEGLVHQGLGVGRRGRRRAQPLLLLPVRVPVLAVGGRLGFQLLLQFAQFFDGRGLFEGLFLHVHETLGQVEKRDRCPSSFASVAIIVFVVVVVVGGAAVDAAWVGDEVGVGFQGHVEQVGHDGQVVVALARQQKHLPQRRGDVREARGGGWAREK